jgi:DNA/RNA endonuclease YhcR with UshA esterase domain
MMVRPFCTLLVAAVLFTPVAAHHAFSPVYDDKRTVTVSGVVTQFRFVNPHALLYLDVAGDGGKVTKWTVEFAGRLNLSENGWADDTIKSGERVTVTGNPTHAEGTNRMAFKKLVRADGSELLPATAQRDSAIEEERRERAKARQAK